jgi:16S rRNA (adenine1518-N6/adenine1519-N6)-dimethyltransferase
MQFPGMKIINFRIQADTVRTIWVSENFFTFFSFTFESKGHYNVMQGLKPKKSLGQHFLTDKNIARKIVSALRAEGCNSIVEIGPGTGVLTALLAERENIATYFVEIDHEAVRLLRESFPGIGDRIIHADILGMDIDAVFKSPLAIIGNLPYNISSPVFFKILENRNRVREVVCMVQKEVARRIASPPGSKDYGILSVLLQAFYSVDYLFTVSPGVFNPPPKVNSGVIRMVRREMENLPCDEDKFFRVVKTSFNQRRKMLRNSLQNRFLLSDADNPLYKMRPEQLSVSDFVVLTNRVGPVTGKQ